MRDGVQVCQGPERRRGGACQPTASAGWSQPPKPSDIGIPLGKPPHGSFGEKSVRQTGAGRPSAPAGGLKLQAGLTISC